MLLPRRIPMHAHTSHPPHRPRSHLPVPQVNAMHDNNEGDDSDSEDEVVIDRSTLKRTARRKANMAAVNAEREARRAELGEGESPADSVGKQSIRQQMDYTSRLATPPPNKVSVIPYDRC